MRVAVLTTDTVHHRYFLHRLEKELGGEIQIVLNIFEQRDYPWRSRAKMHFKESFPNIWRGSVLNPYIRSNYLERKQTTLEAKEFFGGRTPRISNKFPTIKVPSINCDEVLDAFETYRPDVGVVYGTGKISENVFSWPTYGLINAHGGILPEYRGLDTNLWAIYERQFDKVGVTIHRVDSELDTGDVLKISQLPLAKGMSISNLRYHTSIICTDLLLSTLEDLKRGRLEAQVQVSRGRYFGPMPTVKKCVTNLRLMNYENQ